MDSKLYEILVTVAMEDAFGRRGTGTDREYDIYRKAFNDGFKSALVMVNRSIEQGAEAAGRPPVIKREEGGLHL